ncbi:hypothetical protein [Spirillospora sp. NBC_01491]|uniref:hypothetical protein n=1 Tax=Spirillospora sp. NBC_01491 TaxID=2976007 RepID=UPI002E361B58|nr:hypothetical protein [Spirillospora sp. NBC_01491]
MFSEPDDPTQRDRMHTAFTQAAANVDATPEPAAAHAWGHNGRTLGALVTTVNSRAWLRIVEAPQGKQGGKL